MDIDLAGSGHASGLLARRVRPLALMKSSSNTLRAVECVPAMECTLVKQFLNSFMWGLSQMTRNGSMRRFACLEAAQQFLLRKLGCQAVMHPACWRGVYDRWP
jgi:hypothetical protein